MPEDRVAANEEATGEMSHAAISNDTTKAIAPSQFRKIACRRRLGGIIVRENRAYATKGDRTHR